MPLRTKILMHLAFWLIFETFGFFIWTLPFYKDERYLVMFIYTSVVSIAAGIFYFYMHYLYLFPFLLKKKYFQYIIILLLATGLFLIIKGYTWHNFSFVKGLFSNNNQIAGIIFTTFNLLFISAAFRIQETWKNSEEVKKKLEHEIRETELLYLKSQMNPHFLFNTLNNIYGLALKDNPNTALVIRQLKDMMVYNDDFSNGKKICISEELKYLQSYINLFSLRSSLKVNFEHEIYSDDIQIEPMLLIPFIENAFKHGAVESESYINIKLDASKDSIQFKISNPISLNKRKDTTSGIGIKNVQRRLELIYNKRHQFNSIIENDIFTIELQLAAYEK